MHPGRWPGDNIERALRSCRAAHDRSTTHVDTGDAAESRHRSLQPASADGRLRIFSSIRKDCRPTDFLEPGPTSGWVPVAACLRLEIFRAADQKLLDTYPFRLYHDLNTRFKK